MSLGLFGVECQISASETSRGSEARQTLAGRRKNQRFLFGFISLSGKRIQQLISSLLLLEIKKRLNFLSDQTRHRHCDVIRIGQ